ncbi:MAG: hypothetical protein ING69_10755 [Rhodocyclaceae bacterium]|nr:hypothetical protein [Rhodocyclaceae bacterium]
MSSQMREDVDAARVVIWREMLSFSNEECDVDRAYVFVCRGFRITVVSTYGAVIDPYSAAELTDGVAWISGCIPASRWEAPVLRVSLTRLGVSSGRERKHVDQVTAAWCLISRPIVGNHVERASFTIVDAFSRAILRRLPKRKAGSPGQVIVFAVERGL